MQVKDLIAQLEECDPERVINIRVTIDRRQICGGREEMILNPKRAADCGNPYYTNIWAVVPVGIAEVE